MIQRPMLAVLPAGLASLLNGGLGRLLGATFGF